jgi:hypothetical protein
LAAALSIEQPVLVASIQPEKTVIPRSRMKWLACRPFVSIEPVQGRIDRPAALAEQYMVVTPCAEVLGAPDAR